MKAVLARTFAYRAFRRFGFPRMLPMSLTFSLTYRCNSRCRTCNVFRRSASELSLAEYDRFLPSVGKALVWATISGGEPFLRKDVADICSSIATHCRPEIMNIATNGSLCELIPQEVRKIARALGPRQLVVNVSMDDIGERHDAIRGAPGSYEKARKTVQALKEMALPNLTVGIHSVISKFNVGRFPEIVQELLALEPDSYVAEIAEERAELLTVGSDITPDVGAYAEAVKIVRKALSPSRTRRVGRLARAFRLRYYSLSERALRERRQPIPCYAGICSGHIAPDGDVWSCCTKAEPMGNLRHEKYDFRRIWFSPRAREARREIRGGACWCPLANAAYTNMLCHLPSLASAARNMILG